MSATVFVWDMFRGGGVGHASMHISGAGGAIYVSFWPQKHAPFSAGVVHFMNADKKADGAPQWASKPINDLDEGAIIKWWSQIQTNPLIDYANKKPFQLSTSASSNYDAAKAGHDYNIIWRQCSTMVVTALVAGASGQQRLKIMSWLAGNGGRGLTSLPPMLNPFRVPTITPRDVRNLVVAIWGD